MITESSTAMENWFVEIWKSFLYLEHRGKCCHAIHIKNVLSEFC